MSNKRPSAGHIPRPIGAPWNRNSAFSPEQLGALNLAITQGVEHANRLFTEATKDWNLSEEQKQEAIVLLAEGVSNGIAEFSETLKK